MSKNKTNVNILFCVPVLLLLRFVLLFSFYQRCLKSEWMEKSEVKRSKPQNMKTKQIEFKPKSQLEQKRVNKTHANQKHSPQ